VHPSAAHGHIVADNFDHERCTYCDVQILDDYVRTLSRGLKPVLHLWNWKIGERMMVRLLAIIYVYPVF